MFFGIPAGLLVVAFAEGLSTAQAPPAKASQGTIAAASAAMRAGVAAANHNDLASARKEFSRAVLLMPSVETPHAALGAILLAQGDLKAAQPELRRAHQLDPSDVSATLNLARVQSSLNDPSEALTLFHQAMSGSSPPVLSADEALAYATSLSAESQDAEAETQLAEALNRNPHTASLEDALGVVLARSGQLTQALPHLQQAARMDARLPQVQYHLGATALMMGHPEIAVEALRSATATAPENFDAHLQLGRALAALHQDAEALIELHRAAHLRPRGVPAQSIYSLALALQASGDAPGSLPLFAEATTASPALGSELLTNYALARVQTGDAIGALPLYGKALDLGPDSPTLREDYGVAYLQQSDLDHAITQFQAGLQLDPASAHLHYDLGLAYKLKDDLTHAISELQRSAELDPTLPDPCYTLGIIYMQQGRYTDSAAQLRRATALQPTNGEAWAVLGGILKDSDDHVGAIDALRHAIAIQPEQPSLHVQLAGLFVRSGQPDEAAAERKIAADLSRAAVAKQRASFALKSGRALLAQGKLPEAVVQLTVAVQADPDLSESHILLAEAYGRQGKQAEAALERQKAAVIQPSAIP